MIVGPYLCPVCGARVLPLEWTRDDWAKYRRVLRRPICAECAQLLILSPFDRQLRMPTVGEAFAALVEIEYLETIQMAILRRRGLEVRRVV